MIEDNDEVEMHVADSPEDPALDALIVQLASDYNEPPDIVPSEHMWGRIHAARPRSLRPARSSVQRSTWQLLAASVALLAFGIAIGHEWTPHTMQPAVAIAPPLLGTGDASHKHTVSAGADANRAASANSIAPAHSTSRNAASLPQMQPRQLQSRSGSDMAYQLATMRHFTDAEALLTSYATSSHDARGDAQIATWAQSLLSQTRLLLDSPAATDPRRRKLLEDLELVLVDMTHLSPSTAPIERDMLDGTVRNGEIIDRLRTAVPAGGAMHLNGV